MRPNSKLKSNKITELEAENRRMKIAILFLESEIKQKFNKSEIDPKELFPTFK